MLLAVSSELVSAARLGGPPKRPLVVPTDKPFTPRERGATAWAMAAGLGLSASERSDAALIQAIGSERDRAAFQEMFRRYAPRLKAHYGRSGQSETQAEDLVQDVMLSIWRHAESYRPELSSVSTWVFRIARNRFIDVVRKQKYVAFEVVESDGQPELEAPPADEAVAVQQLSARVAGALAELPQEQAEVVRGSYFQHESASEMAARLKLPIGTVKSRLRAAMIYLHKRVFEGGGA